MRPFATQPLRSRLDPFSEPASRTKRPATGVELPESPTMLLLGGKRNSRKTQAAFARKLSSLQPLCERFESLPIPAQEAVPDCVDAYGLESVGAKVLTKLLPAGNVRRRLKAARALVRRQQFQDIEVPAPVLKVAMKVLLTAVCESDSEADTVNAALALCQMSRMARDVTDGLHMLDYLEEHSLSSQPTLLIPGLHDLEREQDTFALTSTSVSTHRLDHSLLIVAIFMKSPRSLLKP